MEHPLLVAYPASLEYPEALAFPPDLAGNSNDKLQPQILEHYGQTVRRLLLAGSA